jgi:hypothetical protein
LTFFYYDFAIYLYISPYLKYFKNWVNFLFCITRIIII